MNIVINLNKPKDISSHQAVTRVKRLFTAKKAGHAGTLDPTATGVLLICLNKATKIARFLSDLDKEYIVSLKLGERTDTYDSSGKITVRCELSSLNLYSSIEKVLSRFTGQIEQVPPMYSAIKISGKPLYKLARQGVEIERRPRKINIYSIDILGIDLPYVDIKVVCSKGTYIRTLCHDIGNELGVGAHMHSLVRTRIGNFKINDSASEEEIQIKACAKYSIDLALSHLQEIVFDENAYNKAKNGLPVNIYLFKTPGKDVSEKFFSGRYIRLKSPDKRLFGIGKIQDKEIKIERLLN